MTIQFKKGILELCILSMLKDGDRYGYDIASKMSESIEVADGSIYLVLRRLKQEDYVTSYLEESSGGPPRKYYVLTKMGKKYLNELLEDWQRFVKNVNSIISNNDNTVVLQGVTTVLETESKAGGLQE